MNDQEEFGKECINCQQYGKWSQDRMELIIPCVNCACQGDPTKPSNSFHNEWNWKWNGKTCLGAQDGEELTVNQLLDNAYATMIDRDLPIDEVTSLFMPPFLVNHFVHVCNEIEDRPQTP